MIRLHKIIIIYLLLINVVGYVMMGFDKYQSKKKGSRISENKLFMFAFLLGAFGVYSGMKYPMYHKAAKAKFKIGIPILIVVNLITTYFFLKILKQ